MRAVSLFSGGGGADIGMRASDLTLVGAVENDPRIADVYRRNLGDHVVVADVREVDPARFDDVDVLWASPPCPNFSLAKLGSGRGGEKRSDIELADAVCRFIAVLEPRYVFLENVYLYRRSVSWSRIRSTLHEMGYWHDLAHVNAADYGIPQTRNRMIVRAARGQMVPYLPPTEPWRGWYDAIADLIHDLPETTFAPWQLEHLSPLLETTLVSGQYNKPSQSETRQTRQPHHVNHSEPAPTITTRFGRDARAFIVPNNRTAWGDGVRFDDEPANAVTINHVGRIRACLLIDGQNSMRSMTMRDGTEPAFTVATKGFSSRAWLGNGRIVKLSPRCLARFQTFPDGYVFPEQTTLAGRIIGNAVPPLLVEKLVRGMIEVGG